MPPCSSSRKEASHDRTRHHRPRPRFLGHASQLGSDTITEDKEYEGYAHLLPAQKGWEEIADYALDWALRHAVTR
jgi:hypothetical protein